MEEIKGPEALKERAGDLEALAKSSVEANVFYEPWMLFPALAAFTRHRRISFLLAYAGARPEENRRPVLCGFFPLERRSTYRGLPLPLLTLWRHPYSYLATPLLKNGFAADVMAAFLSWAGESRTGCRLLELPHVSGSGPFHSALERALSGSPEYRRSESAFERALFRPGESADRYLRESLSKRKRKEYRRLESRLSELGKITYDRLAPGADASPWIREFLRLESSGWKGRSGTAVASRGADREFFSTVAESAHSRNRLHMLALRLDGRAIATKCNLLASDGGFAFKIAYDERFRKYSPGVLLELEHIRHLHDQPALRWMDSCATPDHFMANRLWSARKPMRTLLISPHNRAGNLAVGAVDLIRKLSASRGGRWLEPSVHDSVARWIRGCLPD